MISIELDARASEARLRAKRLPELMAEDFERKKKRSDATVTEFVDILGLSEVYVSTSGGKDSAVLSRLCKDLYPDIQHVMFNTGLEYQKTVDLARRQGAIIIPPKTNWKSFCEEKGYPAVSKQVSKRIHDAKISPLGACITMFSRVYHLADKWLHFLEVDIPISHRCCDEFKKKPSKQLKQNPIVGTRIQESSLRKNAWKKSGCNSYSLDYKKGVSRPISLWTDENVDRYIEENDIELSELYTQYQEKRTGCVCCPYGAHMDGSRFDLLKRIEPKRYEHFMKTKLRLILALSGVEIRSDEDYTAFKDSIQEGIKKWHEQARGSDGYLSWKVRWLRSRYSDDEIIKAVEHLDSQREGNLIVPKERIIEMLTKEQKDFILANYTSGEIDLDGKIIPYIAVPNPPGHHLTNEEIFGALEIDIKGKKR